MKGFKRIIAVLMAVCMIGAVLAGCGGSNDETTGATEATTASAETEGTTEETTDTAEATTEEATVEEATAGNVEAGTNMSDATEISLEQKVSGTVEAGGAAWYSFTTGSEEADYNIVVVNTTSGDDRAIIDGAVYNEAGESIAGSYNYAYGNGVPSTMKIEKAAANTTYYVCLTVENFNSDTGYTVVVKTAE